MAGNEIVYRLVVKDDGTATVEKFSTTTKQSMGEASKSTDNFSTSLVSVASKLAIAYAAVRTVVGVLGSFESNALASERAIVDLNSALQISGNYSLAASRGYEALASAISYASAVSKDQIIAVESLLLRFGVQENLVGRATRATLDYSVAMGKDAQSAAFVLARAMDGTLESLKRYGIELDTKSIPETERAVAVLKAFEDKFGGRSAAAIETTGGAFSRLGNTVAEGSGEVGNFINGILFLKYNANLYNKDLMWMGESLRMFNEYLFGTETAAKKAGAALKNVVPPKAAETAKQQENAIAPWTTEDEADYQVFLTKMAVFQSKMTPAYRESIQDELDEISSALIILRKGSSKRNKKNKSSF